MKLARVTLTGADDSVAPAELINMSARYPFAEWGILVSKSQQGNWRFPSHAWIRALTEAVTGASVKTAISVHVCGSLVRSLLYGDGAVLQHYAGLLNVAQRMQLNFHAVHHTIEPGRFCDVVKDSPQELIFQHDKVNDHLMQMVMPVLPGRCVPLFDYSHGAGVLPAAWPVPNFSCSAYGYAGGLSPGNVTTALMHIGQSAPRDSTVWIDMETHVRSDNDRVFDLSKVALVLANCAPAIGVGHAA